MTAIERYELRESGDEFTLVVYLNPGLTEFSNELDSPSTERESMSRQVRRFSSETFPKIKIKHVKVMVGSILITSLFLGNTVSAQAQYMTNYEKPLVEHTVKSGDTLYSIARKHNVTVDEIKEINELSSNTIAIGQSLALPYTTYTVKAGDTLYRIAINHNTTADAILKFNGMTTNTIFVGQNLKIPLSTSDIKLVEKTTEVTEPEVQPSVAEPSNPVETDPTTYQVKTGDTLYSIANRHGTTVDTIKSLNNLTTNTISIGQTLIVTETEQVTQPNPNPAPEPEVSQPTTDPVDSVTTSYTVVAGDSLFIIANKFGTTVDTIKTENDLTSDAIYVGQKLTIPTSNTDVTQPEQVPNPEPEITPPSPEQEEAIATSYVVLAGDSLFIIANKFGTTIDAIKSVNNLTSDAIYVGQKLTIPTNISVSPEVGVPATPHEVTTDGENTEIPTEELVSEPEILVPDPPTFTLSGPITSNNQEAYEVSGNATPGVEVEISVSDSNDASLTKTATLDENGNFISTFDLSGFSDGNLEVTVFAINEAGKSTIQQASVVKETLIETPEIATSKVANLETASAFSVNGTGKTGATVFITARDEMGNEKSFETKVQENGTFSSKLNLMDFSDYTLTIRAYQQDQLGNKSQHMLVYVDKDTSAPQAPLLESEGVINNQNHDSYFITGSGEANTSVIITITDDGGNSKALGGQTGEEGSFTIPADLSDMVDGTITVQVQQKDSAGNTSSLSSTTLTKNTEIPKVSLKEMTTIYSENEEIYVIEGAADNDTTLSITLSDGDTTLEATTTSDYRGNFSLPINLSSLKDGDITLIIKPTNKYGNVGEAQSLVIQKDTTAPIELNFEMDEYVNNNNQGNFIIRGKTDEDGSTISLRVTDGEKTITEEVNPTNGAFEVNLNLNEFKDGTVTFEITQIDKSGNMTGPQTIQVEKDVTIDIPTITRSGYTVVSDGSTVFNIIGTADPDSTIVIEVADEEGKVVSTVNHTVGENGIFNLDISMNGLDINKAYTFSVNQTDQVGNVSEVITPSANFYTVQSGDNLSMIAKKYNTTVDALRTINNLSGDLIYVDQQLRLPVTASTTLSLGYMYFGDVKSFTIQVLETERSFNTVSPSYFDINQDGTLKLTHLVDRTFIENMHQQGIRVVPFLSNHWNRDVGRALLENREVAAQQIADAVMRYNLDGVNIDIENITDTDRENFTDFVRLVRELLPASKEVSVAVAANPNGWTLGWHGAYDYDALAKYSDYLMMMTYDESYEGSDPGSVASYDWVERSIQYAIRQGVSRDKIVMGVAQYGRFWKEGESTGGKGISNYQIQEMLDKYEHTVTFDEQTKSAKAVVTIKVGDPKMYMLGKALEPGTYTIWFENGESYQAKIGLVDKYDIHGVGNWSIGQEDKSIWSAYSTWFTEKDNTFYDIPAEVTEPVNAEPVESVKTHTVASGDSLWRIAHNNNITVAQLKEANGLSNDVIYVGQVLEIPKSIE